MSTEVKYISPQDCIVHIEASSEAIDELALECEDHVENGPVHEFWGRDDDGNDWCVDVDLR